MSIESELIQKRQEVREEILTLKEQIPSARIFNWLGRAFKHNSLGYWLSNVVLLNLILMTPWILIGLVLKEIEKTIPVSKASLTAVEIIIPSIVVAHIAAQIMLDDVAKRVVEKISTVDDLSKMLLWFKNTWSIRNVATFALPFSLLWGAGRNRHERLVASICWFWAYANSYSSWVSGRHRVLCPYMDKFYDC